MGVTCHGIEIVSAAGVIRGKTCTTVAKSRWTSSRAAASTSNQPIVRQGNLITSRTWHDYAPFFHEFMEMLVAASRAKS